jgi:hypothetical protein
MQLAHPREVAARAIRDFEVALELPHVAEFVGARETERAEGVRADRVVDHVFTEREFQLRRQLGAAQVITGESDRIVDQCVALQEHLVGGDADVLGADPGNARRAGGIADVPSAWRCGPMPKWIRFSRSEYRGT